MRLLSQIRNDSITAEEAATLALLAHYEIKTSEFSDSGLCETLSWALLNDVLILGGSNGLGDWIRNLKCWPTSNCHTGFLELAEKLAPLLPRVKCVVGYSQGAGVAQCLASLSDHSLRLILFAPPRAVSQLCPSHSVTRIYSGVDLMQWLPPWFSNFGVAVRLKGSGFNFIGNHIHVLYRAAATSNLQGHDPL